MADQKDERQEKIQEIKELRIAFNRMVNSDDGKRIIKYLEKRYYVKRPIAFTDATGLAYYEGQRSVILAIVDLADLDRQDAYEKLIKAEDAEREAQNG